MLLEFKKMNVTYSHFPEHMRVRWYQSATGLAVTTYVNFY